MLKPNFILGKIFSWEYHSFLTNHGYYVDLRILNPNC